MSMTDTIEVTRVVKAVMLTAIGLSRGVNAFMLYAACIQYMHELCI